MSENKSLDLLNNFFQDYIISKDRILQDVDEWTLYHYYLSDVLNIKVLELNTPYPSPIRDKDDTPSFSIYENTRSKKEVTYLWKDSAYNLSGDIFELLSRIFKLSIQDVLELINEDFAVLKTSKKVIPKVVVPKPISKSITKIRIKSCEFTDEALQFWKNYHITKELLDWKYVRQVKFVWYSDEQSTPFICKSLTFAYLEYNHKYKEWRYQLYSPYEDKQFKFRNNLSHNQIFGYNHLEYKTELLVITKSNKDIICLKKFGIEAVSPRSETTRIKDKTILLLQSKYKRVITLFDNDDAGIKASQDYDLPSIFIPKDSGCKDFSDYLKMYGEVKAKQLLKELNIL
jgi:hypothetical protein